METVSNSSWRDLYDELKRRRVIRVGTLYVVVFWPVIQIVDILSPALEVSPDTMRYLLIVFVAGLPPVLALAWLFDVNKGGIVRAATGAGRSHDQALIRRSVEWLIIGALLVVIAVLFFFQNTMERDPVSPTSAPPIRAIAVLPFVSLSQAREDEFFADGLTEELLNVLSKVKDLRVIARTSVFAYKGVNKPVQEIGRELNVDTILEGSVRRNDIDDRIRVTAQLIDVETDAHLWSQTFEHEFRDVFKIQDEIAASVVEELKLTLFASDEIKSHESASPEAMVAYSMGRTGLAKRTRAGIEDAVRYFAKAIEADPNYLEAHAGLANAFVLQIEYADMPEDEYLAKAQASVDQALRMDPDSAAAWAAQGLVYMQAGESQTAMSALGKAMELNPSHAMALMWYGNLLEEPAARREYHGRAFDLDPRSPVTGYNLARDLVTEGREAEAMTVFSKIVEADPNYPNAYKLVAEINEFRGRLGAALRQYKRVYALEPSATIATTIAELYVDMGDVENADEWMKKADTASNERSLEWLKIRAFVARGDRPAAEALLVPMLDVTDASYEGYVEATLAAYFLDDNDAVITAFETSQAMTGDLVRWKTEGNTDAAIAAAFAYKQAGRDAEAEAVLAETEARLDAMIDQQVRVYPEVWYNKAQIMTIRGDHNMALIHLQRAVDEGWRQHWRPYVDPILHALLEEPNFKPMMDGLAARMDLMRSQLAFDAAFDDWRG